MPNSVRVSPLKGKPFFLLFVICFLGAYYVLETRLFGLHETLPSWGEPRKGCQEIPRGR